MFQHTAARRRLGVELPDGLSLGDVSTHSRPKAAGSDKVKDDWLDNLFQHTAARRRLVVCVMAAVSAEGFQHTAARRRLVGHQNNRMAVVTFQHTAARRRLARTFGFFVDAETVSTHSRPKAAGAQSQV